MRHIYPTQIDDLSSQAYLLIDASNYLGVTLKKQDAYELIARALGFVSWAQLKIKSKALAHSNSCYEFVQLFKTMSDATDYIKENLRVDSIKAKSIAANLSWNHDSELPFIREISLAYDIDVYQTEPEGHLDTVKYSLVYRGDSSVGLRSLYPAFSFVSKEKLERFLQRHIKVVRADYINYQDVEGVFKKLDAVFTTNRNQFMEGLSKQLSNKEWITKALMEYMAVSVDGYVRSEGLAFQFIDSIVQRSLYAADIDVMSFLLDEDNNYLCNVMNCLDELAAKGSLHVISGSKFSDPCDYFGLPKDVENE